MPPLPKKKRTKSTKGKRWSHSALTPVTMSTCPQCRNAKPPHRVCPTCGYYSGREVISYEPEEAETA